MTTNYADPIFEKNSTVIRRRDIGGGEFQTVCLPRPNCCYAEESRHVFGGQEFRRTKTYRGHAAFYEAERAGELVWGPWR